MIPHEQVRYLSASRKITPFANHLPAEHSPLKAANVEILQINVGKLCNLQCTHCHVEAGPDKLDENMSKDTFDHCLRVIESGQINTIDITGGAPEMNPHLEWFLRETSPLVERCIIRSNLTVLTIPKYAKFIDIFSELGVEIVASLPCYSEKNTDVQRGNKVFQKSIQILKQLNEKGYGKAHTGLTLNLVHNPTGAYLPPDQHKLEQDYKIRLRDDFQIEFNKLFCITNLPISRFLDYLIETDQYEHYMSLLAQAFNPAAVESVMCRNTISVSWDGRLFDCDFNQMLDLSIKKGLPNTIKEFDIQTLNNRHIVTNNHCFGCTAGAGSSCQGALE